MAEQEKRPCCCRGFAAIIIAVLTILVMRGTLTGSWVSIVVLVLAIIIALGSFAGCCCCSKLCKTKEGQEESRCEPPAEPPPTQ